MKRALHTYKGLNTDLARDTISKGFYIDALDIRLTTDVGESNGSITNIKGNVNYFPLPLDDPDFSMTGTMEIIGATSIRETIILYCADDSGTNGWIFKVEYSSINQTLISGPTVIYKSDALNFKKAHPIEAQGRFENESIQRLYWTDYNNFFRSINIKNSLLNLPYGDPNYPPVGNIDVFPSIEYTQPILESIGTGGSLQVGMYQYSYRLKTIDGKQTLVSPPGNMIHVVGDSDTLTSSRMYSGNASYNGANPQITTKAITIKIDTTEYANVFAEVELICAIYTELTDTAQIFSVETVGIDSDSTEIFITHTGTEDSLTELEIDEFTIRTLPFKTPKTITPKDNSLIVANIKGASFSISELLADGETFNAITARYNSSSAVPVSPPPGPTPAQTRAAELQNAFNVVGQANTVGYNQDAHWDIDWHHANNQYKFQNPALNAGALRLGGNGPNIKYNFHLEPVTLDNTGLAWLDSTNLSTNSTNLEDSYGIYPNNSFSNNASPFNSGLIRGYKRGETYRFGVVFYDKKGNASFVEYIGDIKFPDISDLDSVDTAASTVPNVKYFPLSLETSCDTIAPQPRSCITTGYNLGVKFTFDFTSCPTLQDKIDSYQIVRVKRDIQDSKRICSGIMKVGAKMAVGDLPDDEDDAYDLRDPEGSDNINHLFAYHRLRTSDNVVSGNAFGFNGTFDTINNTRINGDPQVVRGAFLHLASSDITYNYPGIRDAISGDSCLLMTGAYGQYFSRIESAQSTTGASETFTGAGTNSNLVQELNAGGAAIRKSFDIINQVSSDNLEQLGTITDYRRKLRSVARLDKSTPAKSMEAIKQFISTQVVEYTSNKQDDSDMGTNLNKGIGSYEGRADTGTAVVDSYFRNFYAVLPHAISADGPDLNDHMDRDGTNAKITTLWAQGATGLLATMKKIDNDPLTGDSLSSVSSYNAFYTGTGTTYSGANQINVLQGNAYPLNKSAENENRTSTPILDILNPRKEVYGGFTESALENNIFMPASPVIPITTLTPEVFGGDIFLNMFTFQESTAWLKHAEPGAFYAPDAINGIGYTQEFDDNMTSTIVMPTESRVNIDLAWGCTTKRDVEFDVDGGNSGSLRTYWRKETDNKTTQFGKSKSMYIDAYNFVNSRESDTVSFFVKPSNFILGSDLNDIRAFISQVKFNGEEIDSWTKYGINDFLDVDDHGPINKIVNWRDEVYFFQNTGMGVYSINPRAITSAGDGIPTELGSAKGLTDHKYISTNHGSIHQWGVKETDMGIYIFDGTHRKIFKVGQGAEPLSEIKGMHSFLKNMEGDFLLHKDEDGDNPILGKGMHIAKDPINNEVIFTFRGTQTTMPLAERTYYPAGVTVTYEPGPSYAIVTSSYTSTGPDYNYLVAQLFSPAADGGGAATQEAKGPNLKSTSLVYDEVAGEFTTRFSACPTMYIENENILLSPNPSAVVGQPSIYRHNVGNWGEFYDNPAEMSIKLVLNENADLNKVLRTIEFNSIIRDDAKVIKRNATISAFQIETEYQDTGKVLFSSGRIKRRFDKWRLKIPRDTIDTSGKDRLRSTYFMLTLYFDNEVNRELILDRIMYYYDIQEF